MYLLAQTSKDHLEEFQVVQPSSKPHSQPPCVRWNPPPIELLKFDDAVFLKSSCSSIGVVIRSHQGLVIASLSKKFPQAFVKAQICVKTQELV